MKIGKFFISKPTLEWKERMQQGDDLFNLENIKATDEALDQYIHKLCSITNASEEDLVKLVKEVTIKLNDINEKYGFFIETLEREELCEFILEAATIAGITTTEDITEEWREW